MQDPLHSHINLLFLTGSHGCATWTGFNLSFTKKCNFIMIKGSMLAIVSKIKVHSHVFCELKFSLKSDFLNDTDTDHQY